jgi:uncharacterized repeat protein (TIGR03803 family)
MGWLVEDSAGNLYGSTGTGGPNHGGTVFKLSPQANGSYQETVLWAFGAAPDGFGPTCGLARDANGNLFGTTEYGGPLGIDGFGTVFELSPQASGGYHEAVLWSFGAANDGYYPRGGVIVDSNGNLFGTTLEGGSYTTQCHPP